MSIATIEQYVERMNAMAEIFGTKTVSLLNANDRQIIARNLDGNLSPENLTCDGERSQSEVNTYYKYFTKAADELLSIDPTVAFYEY